MAMQPLGGTITTSTSGAQSLASWLGYTAPTPGGGVTGGTGYQHTMRVAFIRAGASNSGTGYLGPSTVTATGTNAYMFLAKGDSIAIDFQAQCPPDLIYLADSSSSDTFFVLFVE